MKPSLDPVIHAPARLQVCAMLSAADEMEFGTVRDAAEVSDSVLSKHVKQLEEAGYVRVRKATLDSRQRTWLSLTAAGRVAFNGHLQALTQMVATARMAAE